MSPQRKTNTSEAQNEESNAAVLAELRLMNRLMATLLTRTMQKPEAIKFLAGVGYGANDIATTLNMNPTTVRTALFRARKASGGQTEQSAALGADAKSEPVPTLGDSDVAT
jgi:DNA-directed RNA polymerase specialized sigma24 family protein